MKRIPYVPDSEQYELHYGGQLPVFSGMQYHDGQGLGNIIKSLARSVAPIAKKAFVKGVVPFAKKAGRELLKTGTQVLSDVVEGSDLKSAIAHRGKQRVQSVLGDYLSDDTTDDDINLQTVRKENSLKKNT